LLLSELAALVKVDLDEVAERVLEVELLAGNGGLISRAVRDYGLAKTDLLATAVVAGRELALLHAAVLAANGLELFLGQLAKN